MIFVVSRKINVLSKIKGRQHWQKLRGEGVGRIVRCMLKSPVMINSWGIVAASERKELNSSRNLEKVNRQPFTVVEEHEKHLQIW